MFMWLSTLAFQGFDQHTQELSSASQSISNLKFKIRWCVYILKWAIHAFIHMSSHIHMQKELLNRTQTEGKWD